MRYLKRKFRGTNALVLSSQRSIDIFGMRFTLSIYKHVRAQHLNANVALALNGPTPQPYHLTYEDVARAVGTKQP